MVRRRSERLIAHSTISIGRATQLAVDGAHVCVVLADRTVACAGFNDRGPLGDRTRTNAGAIPFALGLSHSCVVRDGEPACWGENREGQLGDGTMTDRETATPVRW